MVRLNYAGAFCLDCVFFNMAHAAAATDIRTQLESILQGKDLAIISLGEVRKEVSLKLGLGADGLDSRQASAHLCIERALGNYVVRLLGP